jgi:hypothetical protein
MRRYGFMTGQSWLERPSGWRSLLVQGSPPGDLAMLLRHRIFDMYCHCERSAAILFINKIIIL